MRACCPRLYSPVQTSKHQQIGPVGYSFAINPNGYAVFHPNLKHSGNYMRDPPNIDLMELEFEKLAYEDDEKTQVLELRNNMIEGYSDKMDIAEGLFLSPDKKYASVSKATYAFTNITNTTFRLGLSIPDFQRNYPYFQAANLPVIHLTPNMDHGSFHIAPWDYFGSLPEKYGLVLNSSLSSLIAILQSGKIQANQLSTQELQLLHLLALDVASSETFMQYTPMLRNTVKNHLGIPMQEVVIHFMAFNGGLTVVYPAEKSSILEKDFDLTNSTYYKRAMYSEEYILMPVKNDSTHLILAARAIRVKIEGKDEHRFGVTGVVLEEEGFRSFIFGTLMNTTLMTNSMHNTWTCEDTGDIVCYVVDDGGFLVASNMDNENKSWTGSFLGEADPQLWHFLQNEKVYGKVEQYDFQATCKSQANTKSAAHCSYSVPSINRLYETLTLSWWTSKVTWAISSFNIYNWLFGSSSVYGQDDSGDDEEDCVMATAQYYLIRSHADNISGTLSCKTGSRQIIAQILPKANLMLIVAEYSCESLELDDKPVNSTPRRISIDEERTLVCHLSRHPRKRVQSYGCYDSDPNEDVTKCGAPALPGSRLLIVITTVITITTICLLSADHR